MKNMKKGLTLLALVSVALLGSCGGNQPSVGPSTDTGNSGHTSDITDVAFYVTYKGQQYEQGAGIEVYLGDKTAILVATDLTGNVPEFTYTSSDPSVLGVDENNGLLKPVKAGSADITVHPTGDDTQNMVFTVTVKATQQAEGAFSYATASYEEKANILGALEKYAVDNYLTGITMFSNGSNIVYNNRYVPTAPSYINGYGWGTMREGKLTGKLPNPFIGHDAEMYQVGTTALPAHLNAMNASGSDVSDAAQHITTSYFSTRMNETNDGYEWYPLLSTDDRPLPLSDSGSVITENQDSVLSNKWRIHVKTGEDFVYRTASTKSKNGVQLKSFDGRKVALDDYIAPIKYMLTGYNGQYRGPEQTKGISGLGLEAADYLAKTSNLTGDYNYYNEKLWKECNMDNVVKTGHDESGDYIEFTLQQPCTQFYAMYYLSSSLYSPLPGDFLNLWNPKDLGKSPDGYKPLDTMLSTGPYYITRWEDKDITFAKNDKYFYTRDVFASGGTRDVYQLKGFEYHMVDDPATSKNAFEAGQIDSYAPSKEDLKTGGAYSANDGVSSNGIKWRKYETKGDSNFKLNVNASTVEQWTNRFGKNGTIYQHDFNGNETTKADYLQHRPYMSDIHFLNFLSFSMDRKTICESRGMKPTQEYFSDNYLIDPESGVSYNSTDAHKAVLADRYNDTYGYNPDAAKKELELAIEGSIKQMAEAGKLEKEGNAYVISVRVDWMNPNDTKEYSDVFDSIKKAFDELVSKKYYGNYILRFVEPTPSSDYNAVYDKMKRGEFDLGFGTVSGNALNPINFVEVLKSDNSSGFTLNWGADTDKVDAKNPIVYDGKTWSFDGLWNAANTAVLLNSKGDLANATKVGQTTDRASQSVTYKLAFKELVNAGAKLEGFSIQATNGGITRKWNLSELGATASNNYTVEITLDKAFNTVEAEADVVNTPIATLTFVYSVDFNGQDKIVNSTLRLPTYVGINK